LDNTEDLRISK